MKFKVSGTSNLNLITNACEYAALVFKLSLVELGFLISSLQRFLNFANSFLSCFLPSDRIYSINLWHIPKAAASLCKQLLSCFLPSDRIYSINLWHIPKAAASLCKQLLSCFLPSDLIYRINFWHYQKQQLHFANHCLFSSFPTTQKLNFFTQSKSTVKTRRAIKRWEAKTLKALFQSRNYKVAQDVSAVKSVRLGSW